jgi:hypothetical protein
MGVVSGNDVQPSFDERLRGQRFCTLHLLCSCSSRLSHWLLAILHSPEEFAILREFLWHFVAIQESWLWRV